MEVNNIHNSYKNFSIIRVRVCVGRLECDCVCDNKIKTKCTLHTQSQLITKIVVNSFFCSEVRVDKCT